MVNKQDDYTAVYINKQKVKYHEVKYTVRIFLSYYLIIKQKLTNIILLLEHFLSVSLL